MYVCACAGDDDNVCDASSRSIFSHVDRLSFVCLAVCVRLSVNVCMCVHEALFYKYICGGVLMVMMMVFRGRRFQSSVSFSLI